MNDQTPIHRPEFLYYLASRVHKTDRDATIPITAKEFQRIARATQTVRICLGLEEKFDLLLENYAELERSLLKMALRHSIFPGEIDTLLSDGAHTMNRRLVNLLTTARLYLDQARHDLSDVHGSSSDAFQQLEQAAHREYDTNSGYRIMEALRNYAQHQSLPIHAISFPMSRADVTTTSRLRFGVVLYTNVDYLREERFKTVVLNDLEAVADQRRLADLLPIIRSYVESLGHIHAQVRLINRVALHEADEILTGHLTLAQSTLGVKSGLFATAEMEDARNSREFIRSKRSIYLGDRLIRRREYLERKNADLKNIAQRYVSSE